jgi:hypothetical protein
MEHKAPRLVSQYGEDCTGYGDHVSVSTFSWEVLEYRDIQCEIEYQFIGYDDEGGDIILSRYVLAMETSKGHVEERYESEWIVARRIDYLLDSAEGVAHSDDTEQFVREVETASR